MVANSLAPLPGGEYGRVALVDPDRLFESEDLCCASHAGSYARAKSTTEGLKPGASHDEESQCPGLPFISVAFERPESSFRRMARPRAFAQRADDVER